MSAERDLSTIQRQLAAIPDPVALLAGLFAFAPVGFQIYRASGHSLLVNAAFIELFGSEPPPDYNVLEDDVLEKRGVLDQIRSAFAGETVHLPPVWYDPRELRSVEVTEGKRVAIEATFFPLRDGAGALTHVAVVFADRTELQLERERLVASEERLTSERDLLQAIIEQSTEGIIVADAKGTIEVFNAAASRQHGVPQRAVAAPDWADAFGLFDLDGTRLTLEATPLHQALQGRVVGDARWRVRRPDGELRTLAGSAAPLRHRDGSSAGAVLVTRDETERERVDEALRRSEELARAGAEQFRTFADAIPVLAWYAEPDGYIPWYNRRWHEYTGMPLDQQEGWKWQSVHDPNDLQRVVDKWKASLATGQAFEDQFRLRGRDGEYRWFLTRVEPLRDQAGRVVRWFGTNVDIEDQKRAERSLDHERARAEEANRAKDEFLSIASHELRTPLNAILGWASLLRTGGVPEARRAHALETIERNARAQVRLIEDILDVSRIMTGKMQLEVGPMDPTQMVRAAVDVVRPAADAKEVELLVEVEPPVGMVQADAGRLQQVVWNLIANAVKFTPQNGRVEVRLTRAGDALQLEVKDSGQGIDAEFLPHLFEPFRQADASTTRAHGGLGLGLAIVKRIVELHGGEVEAMSDGLGLGSTFVVRIPVVERGVA